MRVLVALYLWDTVLVLKYTWFVPCTKVLVPSVYLGSTGIYNTPSQNTRTTGWFSVRNEVFEAWVLVRENAVNYFRVGRMGAFFDGGWNHGVCWGNRLRFRLRGSKLYQNNRYVLDHMRRNISSP